MPISIQDCGVAELAASQHGVFSLEQLVQLGLNKDHAKRRCRSGRWLRLHPGVYAIAGVPATSRLKLMAAILAVGPGAAASHGAAAALHELPGFGGDDVIRLVREDRRQQSAGNLRGTTSLPAHHITTIDSIPVTTAERTLVDLAGSCHMGRVARALDTSLARGLVTIRRVRRVHDELAERGRHGIVVMRTLLDERGEGYVAPESELERQFLRLLLRFRFPMPEQQNTLGRARLVGRVDFYYPAIGLIVEVDGRFGHTALLDRENDMRRDAEAAAMGLRTVRLTWNQVTKEADATAELLSSLLRDV